MNFKTELLAEAVNSRPTANLIGDYDNVKANVERRCDPQDGAPQWRILYETFASDVHGLLRIGRNSAGLPVDPGE